MKSSIILAAIAATMLVRSEFDMGKFAPFVGDEVTLMILIEATKAE